MKIPALQTRSQYRVSDTHVALRPMGFLFSCTMHNSNILSFIDLQEVDPGGVSGLCVRRLLGMVC